MNPLQVIDEKLASMNSKILHNITRLSFGEKLIPGEKDLLIFEIDYYKFLIKCLEDRKIRTMNFFSRASKLKNKNFQHKDGFGNSEFTYFMNVLPHWEFDAVTDRVCDCCGYGIGVVITLDPLLKNNLIFICAQCHKDRASQEIAGLTNHRFNKVVYEFAGSTC